MTKRILKLSAMAFGILISLLPANQALTSEQTMYWVKLRAASSFERTIIVNTGTSIEGVRDGYAYGFAGFEELQKLKKLGWLESYHAITDEMDFPVEDEKYHNYAELTAKLDKIAGSNSKIVRKISLGKSIEGRDLWALEISGKLEDTSNLPAVFFMGGHHAREHLSVEVPLLLAEHLVNEYTKGNAAIQSLLNSRLVTILPAVNPDGLEFDVATGSYKFWRKNRRANSNGSFGVDLNRNYGFKWGTGGSSNSPYSDIYMGPTPFSEPETQAIKKYVDSRDNINILLSFHTFSQLILYPWGHTHQSISEAKDYQTLKTMAEKMAEWNGYTPQQSSELYIASGDTTDWSYGTHKIFSFTFELDPANSGFNPGGFYPGDEIIQEVFRKNLNPAIYLIQLADNPYRATETGFNSDLGF
jgi:carboxypeptidase T